MFNKRLNFSAYSYHRFLRADTTDGRPESPGPTHRLMLAEPTNARDSASRRTTCWNGLECKKNSAT